MLLIPIKILIWVICGWALREKKSFNYSFLLHNCLDVRLLHKRDFKGVLRVIVWGGQTAEDRRSTRVIRRFNI